MGARLVIGMVAFALSAGAPLAQPARATIVLVGPPPPPIEVDEHAGVFPRGMVTTLHVFGPRIYVSVIDDRTGIAWKLETEAAQLQAAHLPAGADIVGHHVVAHALQEKDRTCEPECLARTVHLFDLPEPGRWPVDGRSPMVLEGRIETVDVVGDSRIAHLDVPGSGHWAIDLGPASFVHRNLIDSRDLKPGAKLAVRGFRAADKTCAPECKAGARRYGLTTLAQLDRAQPPPPALPPLSFPVDENAPVLLKGRVVSSDWDKPRPQIHIVLDSGERWLVEGGSRNTLLRGGITVDSLKPGVAIVVRGYQSKDKACASECRAQGRDISFPNRGNLIFGIEPPSPRAQPAH